MTSKEDKLLAAKNRLCTALGETSTKTYMSNLKMWFRKIWTKEQFDLECRKLFTSDQKHLHNEFFLAILNKITIPLHSQQSQNSASIEHSVSMSASSKSASASGKKRKRNSRPVSERTTFEPIELYDFLPEDNFDLRPPSTPLPQPRFAAQELFLPDNGLILGRLLVAAWENGLANADENVCELVVVAVQVSFYKKICHELHNLYFFRYFVVVVFLQLQTLLKNILSAILKSRKHYRVTNNGNFFYDVGHPMKDPFLRNTATRQIIDDHPFEINKELSSTNFVRQSNDDSVFLASCENIYAPPTKNRITILDLYKALQDKNIIPCHSVYANNIERISQMLN